MSDFIVEAEKRSETGKNANRRLRAQGKLPAVVYGQGKESLSVSLDPTDLLEILYSESGRNTIFSLKVDSETSNVLIKAFQLDPLKGELIHADLQTISMDETMEFRVPVEITGTPAGAEAGGILDVVLREVEVECLPGEVPDSLHVDVTKLEIGDAVRVVDLEVPSDKVTILSDSDLVVATVVPPRPEEEEAEELLEEEMLEPELIGRERDEDEEGGEEPDENE